MHASLRAPILSVVVPVYNVEAYIERCLKSVLEQSFSRLEVIVVDDGSPDDSMGIVRRLARRDRRVRVVVQANAGLGAARNTGVRHARGRYITFVDSDDWITPGAYLAMVRTLERTGSDFVVGAMQRERGRRTWMSAWVRRFHARDRFGVRLEDDPDALKDIFAWNKVFRREFFDRVVGTFPEKIRYEDQEPITRALVRSAGFDVLEKVVYTWVSRDDGSSITQQKRKIEDLTDRVSVMRTVGELLTREAGRELYRQWLSKTIGMDLVPYFQALPRSEDPRYVALVADTVATYAEQMEADDWRRVPVMNRLLALAAWRGGVADVVAVLRTLQEDGAGYRLRSEGDRLVAELDAVRRLSFDVADELLEVSMGSLEPRARLTHVTWLDESTVELRGHARVQGIDLSTYPMELRCELRAGDGEETLLELPLVRTDDVTLDERSGDAYNSYASSAFRARLSLDDARRSLGDRLEASVFVVAVVRGHSFVDRFRVNEASYDGDVLPRCSATEPGQLLLSFTSESGLTLRRVDAPVAEVVGARLRDREVELHVRGRCEALICEGGAAPVRVDPEPERGGRPDVRVFRFELPRANKLKAERPFRWTLRGVHSGGRSPLPLQHGALELDRLSEEQDCVRFTVDDEGGIGLFENRVRVVVDVVELSDDERTLRVVGRADVGAERALEPRLIGARSSLAPREARVLSSGPFELEFPLTEHRPGEGEVLIRPGSFGIYATPDPAKETRYGAIPSRALRAHLPCEEVRTRFRLRKRRRFKAGMCWVDLRPPQKMGEIGRHARRSFRVALESRPRSALRDATLFESYGGAIVGCSPAALLEFARRRGVGGELFATVSHGGVSVPPGVRPVLLHSREYFEVLHTAKTLINNNNFPYYFRKKAGQRYIQTWHGTPLKRIGGHVPRANLSLSYRELMKREARGWDVLLAQNEYSARIFPEAFGYEGSLVVEGYPRNDFLFANQAARAGIRARFGIEPHEFVVLYAPTWRDNVKADDGRYDFVSYLDVSALREHVGGDLVVLRRGHVNTSLSVGAHDEDSVVDVTPYPNVSELMLASDCLVTDYSSIMFDYAALGRPIYLLAPDLENYMDEVRGFYFDIREKAPGFIGRTSEEIATRLAADRRGAGADAFEAERERFRAEFASHDDGSAAERVARIIWSR